MRLCRVNLYNVDEVLNGAGFMWLCNECAVIHEDLVDSAGYGSGGDDEICDICNVAQVTFKQYDWVAGEFVED